MLAWLWQRRTTTWDRESPPGECMCQVATSQRPSAQIFESRVLIENWSGYPGMRSCLFFFTVIRDVRARGAALCQQPSIRSESIQIWCVPKNKSMKWSNQSNLPKKLKIFFLTCYATFSKKTKTLLARLNCRLLNSGPNILNSDYFTLWDMTHSYKDKSWLVHIWFVHLQHDPIPELFLDRIMIVRVLLIFNNLNTSNFQQLEYRRHSTSIRIIEYFWYCQQPIPRKK